MKTTLQLLVVAMLLELTPLPARAQTGNTNYGSNSLFSLTTGNYNSAFGDSALYSATANTGNTAIGWWSQYYNTTGSYNTASGLITLYYNTSGFFNNADGYAALYSNTSGYFNNAYGVGALYYNTTGSHNIGLGDNAGSTLTTGDYNIDIGNYGVTDEANTIRIGDPNNQYATFIAGIVGVTTGNDDAVNVVIDSNGQLGTISSSRRYKEDITNMSDASAKLLELRPVSFRYKKPYRSGEKPIQYGLIAEEVAEILPELVVFNHEGQPETVKYQDLAPMLLNEFQKEHRRVIELQKQVTALGERVAKLDSKDDEREDRPATLKKSFRRGQPVTIPTKLKTASR